MTLQAVIKFLDHKLQRQQVADGQASNAQIGRINLALETLAIFLRSLQAAAASGPPDVAIELANVQRHALAMHPSLQAWISRLILDPILKKAYICCLYMS